MSNLKGLFNRRRMTLPACLLVIFVVCLSATPAQSPKGQDDTVKLKAHLITMDVMVKDKKGKYITDLKADDFTIVENGVPQKVEFFDPPLLAGSVSNQPKAADSAKPVMPSSGPTHIISLVLDGATTEQGNLKQVREGMLRYIRERIAPVDMVAIFAVTTDLRLLQAFTQDKAKMIAAIDKTNDLTASNKNSERNQIAQDIRQAQLEMEGLPGTSGLPQSAEAA